MTQEFDGDDWCYFLEGSREATQAVTAPPKPRDDGSGLLVYVAYYRSGQDMYITCTAEERNSEEVRSRESRGGFKPVAWWNGSKWLLLRSADWTPYEATNHPRDRERRVTVPSDITEWTDHID